jgi:tRNA A37 methylthiotransferase MiaB
MHEYFNYLIRLHGVEYIKIFESIKNFIEFLGLNYKEGYNYSHFKDYEVIPRLTLSTGCLNNCTFCTIEKILKEVHIGTILRQTRSFKPLKFKLVYINDKTFGQCANYKLLPGLYREIKTYNKKFEGFIIQTTTSQFLKLDNEFIHEAHIKFIELGIETFNDPILKKYHKPSNEFLSEQSIDKIRELKTVQLIPNILIGIPEETEFTYARTLNFLNTHKNIISHLNIYNLAVYDNTPLSKTLKHTESDKNENSINKSFHKNKNIHIQFYKDVHEFGINILCEKKTI